MPPLGANLNDVRALLDQRAHGLAQLPLFIGFPAYEVNVAAGYGDGHVARENARACDPAAVDGVAYRGHDITPSAEVAHGRQAAPQALLSVCCRAEHLLHVSLAANLVYDFLVIPACGKGQVSVPVEHAGHQGVTGELFNDRAFQMALAELRRRAHVRNAIIF